MTQLIKYEAACRALAACKAVDEVKDLMDKAEAMRLYGRMAKDKTLETDAAEIRMRAERRLGQMLAQQKQSDGLAKPGPKSLVANEGTPKLADVGISYDLSSRAQKLAAVPEETFENEVGQWRDRVKAEGARVTTRLQNAGEKALKEGMAERGLTEADMQTSTDEMLKDYEETLKLNIELNERIAVITAEDSAKKLNDQQTEIYGLRGRIQQLIGSEKSMADKLEYNAKVIHTLRKILGVQTHAEIIEMVRKLAEKAA